MNSLIDLYALDALQMLINIMLGVISLIVGYATTKLPGKWAAEAQAAALVAQSKLRETLHSAAVSGIAAGKEMGLSGSELVAFAMRHVIKSAPDAVVGLTPVSADLLNSGPAEFVIKRLPVGVRDVLENIVIAKIEPEWRAPIIATE